jgi:ABC-type amino acid transport system permease subunit
MIFYTLPAVVFQSATDLKVDLAASGFSVLALTAFFDWLERGETKRLNLSFFILGFAFTIKYSVLFMLAAMMIGLIFVLIKKRERAKKVAISVSLALAFFCVPFVPYATRNYFQTKSVRGVATGSSDVPSICPIASEPDAFSKAIEENITYEQERYDISKGLTSKVWGVPFAITFNTTVPGRYMDIGFIFLSLLPLAIFGLLLGQQRAGGNISIPLSIIGVSYWFFWLGWGRGIIWYGFPGFIFLFLALTTTLDNLSENGGRLAGLLTIYFWFITTLLLRVSYLPAFDNFIDKQILINVGGGISDDEYFRRTLPRFYQTAQLINAETNVDDGNSNVLLESKYLTYFLKNNDRLVNRDNNLMAPEQLFKLDNAGKLACLKTSGFKFIFFSAHDIPILIQSEEIANIKSDFLHFLRNGEYFQALYDDQVNDTILVRIK